MARRVFFSFHYQADSWRASQVRNIGALDGNSPCSDNDWEAVTRGGDAAIKKWIDDQLSRRSCAVILIGSTTAGRKWIGHEIKQSWNQRKGLVGVHVHNLKDRFGDQSTRGSNPFDGFTVDSKPMSTIVKIYNPPYYTSTDVYNHIAHNVAAWVDEAVAIRNRY